MKKQQPPSTLLPGKSQEARIAGLVVVGLLLFVFEAYIPRPIPWLKFGLANIATLIALVWLGWRAAILVTFLRIVIGAFFIGTLFSPGFFLSLCGGLVAVGIMSVLYQLRVFSLLSISVTGAVTHNMVQLLVATLWLFHNAILWRLAPYLILTGIITGIAIGIFTIYVLNKLKESHLWEDHSSH
ncbi:MAG: Gx transporter family protein [Calditrichaeota bacterium]|nr:MAG: Gx transporter family protein [Calditrichota bacterium]